MKKTIFTALILGIVLLSGCSLEKNNNAKETAVIKDEVSKELQEKIPVVTKEEYLKEDIKDSTENITKKEGAVVKGLRDSEKYYNKEMGVSFSYNPKEYIVKESKDLIEIGFVEDSTFTNTTKIKLFKKEENISIKDFIASKFLNNDTNKNCTIVEKKFDILPVSSMERYGIFPKVNDGYYDFEENCGIKDGWRNDMIIIYNPLFSREKVLVIDPSMDHYGFLEQIGME